MRIKLPVLALCLFCTFSSFAGIFIEPYVGYLSASHSGELDNYGTSLDIPTTKGTGPAYGARVGYGAGMLGLALDYMMSNLKENEKGFNSEITNIGATFMVGFPFIRAWAGYIFSSQYKFKDDENSLNGTEKGSGYKLGLGWSPLPFVSLNLEYLMLKYDSAKYDNFQDVDRSTNGFLLSLSVPITF